MRAAFFNPDAAAKHLLRNMHDPDAVRVNPLVQHFFEAKRENGGTIDPDDALTALREAVINTVDRVFSGKNAGRAAVHLQRQREIVLRCHLGGESDKIVQVEMALGRRQFYREKQRARVRLAKALRTLIPARLTSDTACVDVRDLTLAHFRAVREAGDAHSAIRIARSMSDAATDPHYKLMTGALTIECYAEHGLWKEADELLESMNAWGTGDPRHRAWLAWSRGQRHWLCGAFDRSVACCEEVITHLHDTSISRDASDDELLCWTHLQLAHSRHMLGGYESALASLESARQVLERRPTLPPRVNANVLYHLGGVLSTIPGCMESALRHLLEAYDITTKHGLVRDASGIALLLAHIYAQNGEVERALKIGREGLLISQRVRGEAGHAWQCLSFAPVEMAAGNMRRALELARFGARGGEREPTRLAHAHTIEAEVLLRLGDASSAIRLAGGATVVLHSQGQAPRLLNRAARVYAAAAQKTDEGTARSIIGEIGYEREARDLLDSLRHR